MATTTDKKVTRVTTGAYASKQIGWKARKIVVTILPGDTLVLRLQRTKKAEYISIKEVFETAYSRRIFAENASNPKVRAALRGRRVKRGEK